jgi:hypothetical protein
VRLDTCANAPAAKKRKPKPVTVAAGQATAATGATQRLTVRFAAKARKVIKKRSIKATATVTARGTDGATAQVRKPITLRRGKAKSKR